MAVIKKYAHYADAQHWLHALTTSPASRVKLPATTAASVFESLMREEDITT